MLNIVEVENNVVFKLLLVINQNYVSDFTTTGNGIEIAN